MYPQNTKVELTKTGGHKLTSIFTTLDDKTRYPHSNRQKIIDARKATLPQFYIMLTDRSIFFHYSDEDY